MVTRLARDVVDAVPRGLIPCGGVVAAVGMQSIAATEQTSTAAHTKITQRFGLAATACDYGIGARSSI